MKSAQEYDDSIIANAAYFVVTQFLGRAPGRRPYVRRARVATRAEALQAKADILAKEPRARLLAYAIDEKERQAHIG